MTLAQDTILRRTFTMLGAGEILTQEADSEDAERLQRMFSRCSQETIYLRFHLPLASVYERLIEFLVGRTEGSGLTLVAVCGNDILGHAMYVRDEESDHEAEFAIVVEDDRQARDLGTLLLSEITEEPTRADDFAGHARIAEEARTTIQIGENWWGPYDVQKSLEAGACDYGMPDAMTIGGVTGWLRTAALAETVGLPQTSHIFPEISAHLLAASPTAHRLEYLNLAAPILKKSVRIEDGHALVPERPGIGLEWDEEAVSRFLVR